MHNSNSKKILSDTATTNLLEISPANQAVLNYNLSSAINADRPSYQNHFINHSFYPPLVTTSYNHQKHAQDVNDNLSEFFNQTTKTHETLVKQNPLQAQTYLQNRIGFLSKAIDQRDPSSALNQSGLQHVSVVDKFGQTHANFGSAQINNLKTLSDMWERNNQYLSQIGQSTPRYYLGPNIVSLEPAPAPRGPAPDSPAGPALASPGPDPVPPGSDTTSPAGPVPTSPRPAPASPRQASASLGSDTAYQAEHGSTSPKNSKAAGTKQEPLETDSSLHPGIRIERSNPDPLQDKPFKLHHTNVGKVVLDTVEKLQGHSPIQEGDPDLNNSLKNEAESKKQIQAEVFRRHEVSDDIKSRTLEFLMSKNGISNELEMVKKQLGSNPPASPRPRPNSKDMGSDKSLGL